MASPISTKVLILSDTHAASHHKPPTVAADIVIHCGDLTEESKLCEFQTTLDLIKECNAPLKIVIAGNHDWTLDLPTFHQKVKEAGLEDDPELVAREYGEYGEVQRLFNEAKQTHNVHLLDEGKHTFTLANGAKLTVFASPFTPSVDADWGFQYRLADGHKYDIPQGAESPDIVMTHGPAEGVLDRTAAQKRLGCPHLFQSLAKSRPLVHCFGHVHAGWGARRVAWRDSISIDAPPTHFTAIDNGASQLIDSLPSYRRGKFDDDTIALDKSAKLASLRETGYQAATISESDRGIKTLFVNAAMEGDGAIPFNVPWLVDVPLRSA